MGALSTVELVGGRVGLHLLGGGIGVRVWDFGDFAFGAYNIPVSESEERGCDEGDGENIAGNSQQRRQRMWRLWRSYP